ncbi:MAG: hypothetical protein ABI988_19995 [Nitrospirota bacterium]
MKKDLFTVKELAAELRMTADEVMARVGGGVDATRLAGEREAGRGQLDSVGNGMEVRTGRCRGHGLVRPRSGLIPEVHRRGLSKCLGFPGLCQADDPKDRY